MRVHELAKALKLSSKELLQKLHKMGIDAKSHMSLVDEKTVQTIRREIRTPQKASRKVPGATGPIKGSSAPSAVVTKHPIIGRPATSTVPQEAKTTQEVKEQLKEAAPIPKQEIRVQGESVAQAATVVAPIGVEIPITVGALAPKLNLRIPELIKSLMSIGVFANVNQLLSEEIVFKLAAHLGLVIEKLTDGVGELEEKEQEEDIARLKPRPPVVTLMGHVDHGKTSLLDAIRKSNVASREAGQITQHIGAYHVDLTGRGRVTFLDTPGHEAFTAMRARGATVTDVVVLVVAADDGVMPQTIEAMDHAKDADVPMVVAINKCDHPQANPQKVMVQLQKLGLVAEEWGGKTIVCKVSAKTGEGIDRLLEMLLLEAEVLELRANPDQPAQGFVIEGRLTRGSGPVATVIIRKGTLRVGDIVIAGPFFGRVRALRDDRGKAVREAGPAYPVEVHGLNGVPQAGEILHAVADDKSARRIAEKRSLDIRGKERKGIPKHLSLETLHERIQEGAFKELKLIIKGDVQGSVEALTQSLEKLSTERVRLHVIHGGVGSINESDVMLAAASDAVVLGFHVKAEPRAEQLSHEEGVDIRFYNIIYEAVEDVHKAMEGLLEPSYQEVVEGRASVRKVFRSSKAGTVGGGVVAKGKLTRAGKVRLIRNQVVVFDGKLSSLRRFKDDVREVTDGYEFGFVLEGFDKIVEGDILEAYKLEKGPAQKLK